MIKTSNQNEYSKKIDNKMVIRTLYRFSPMKDDNYTQTEKNIQEMKVVMQFPNTSTVDNSIEEIRHILLDIFSQSVDKEIQSKEKYYE